MWFPFKSIKSNIPNSGYGFFAIALYPIEMPLHINNRHDLKGAKCDFLSNFTYKKKIDTSLKINYIYIFDTGKSVANETVSPLTRKTSSGSKHPKSP